MSTDAPNVIQARSDVPFTEIQIRTRTPLQRSREIGAEIVARHSASGTFDLLSAGAIRILSISMAIVYGEARDDIHGLLIIPRKDEDEKALRIRLSRAAGLAERSNYEPIRELIQHKLIRRISIGGNSPDGFVLRMPDDLLSTCDQADEQLSPSLSRDENRQTASQDNDGQTITEPRVARASCDGSLFRDGVRHDSVTDHDSVTEPKNIKSDSDAAIGRARASRDGTEIAKLNSSSNKAKLKLADLETEPRKEKLKEGRSIVQILIEDGGFAKHNAHRLAKKSNATFRQVVGSIRLCNKAEHEFKEGLRKRPVGNREAFITKSVNEMWEVPPDEVETALENLPEHEQEEIARALETDVSENPFVRMETAVLALAKPVKNEKIEVLATRVQKSMADVEEEIELARQTAEAAKRKVTQARPLTPHDRRRILGSLDPGRRQQLLDQVLARYTPDQIAAWHPFEPMDMPSVIDAVCELAEVSRQIVKGEKL